MTIISPRVTKAILKWSGAKSFYVRKSKSKKGRRTITLNMLDPNTGELFRYQTFYARIKYQAMHNVKLPDHIEVDHKDGDRSNDKLSNLRPLTKSKNIKEAHKLGLMNDNVGENNPRVKITSKKVTKLRRLFAIKKLSIVECMAQLNVPIKEGQVGGILRGTSWKYQDHDLIDQCLARLNSPEFISASNGKLTAEDVLKLRKYRHKTGESLDVCIANLGLNITVGNAWAIIAGKSWKSAGGPIEIPGAYGGKQRIGNNNAAKKK